MRWLDQLIRRKRPDAPHPITPPAPKSHPFNGAVFQKWLDSLRGRAGISLMLPHPRLYMAAWSQACWMAATGRCEHERQDSDAKSNLKKRLNAVDFIYQNAGENIAVGYSTAEAVLEAWFQSPGHQANLFNPGFAYFGIEACVDTDSRPYWCLVLGTPVRNMNASKEVSLSGAIDELDTIVTNHGVRLDAGHDLTHGEGLSFHGARILCMRRHDPGSR